LQLGWAHFVLVVLGIVLPSAGVIVAFLFC
jgi:hypothetical protein